MERRALYALGAATLAGAVAPAGDRAAAAPVQQTATVARCGYVQISTSPETWVRLDQIVRMSVARSADGTYSLQLTGTAVTSRVAPDQLLAACETGSATPPPSTPVAGAANGRCGFVQPVPGWAWAAVGQLAVIAASGSGSTITGPTGAITASLYTPAQLLAGLCAAGG